MKPDAMFDALGIVLKDERNVTASQLATLKTELTLQMREAMLDVRLMPGPRGEPGVSPTIEDVVKELLPLVPLASDGTGIKDIAVSGNELTIELTDERSLVLPLVLPQGPAGDKGDTGDSGVPANPKDVVELLAGDEGFVASLRGKDASPSSVADLLRGDEAFVESLKAPAVYASEVAEFLIKDEDFALKTTGPAGLKGDKGDQGEPGLDRLVVDAMPALSNVVYDKNALVRWQGGLFQAGRKAYGTPSDDPSGFNPVVAGVAKSWIEHDATDRKLNVHVQLSDGTLSTCSMPDVPRYVTDLTAEKFVDGDHFHDGTTLQIRSGDDWKSVELAGQQGKQGDAGPRGAKGRAGTDGVGLNDISCEMVNGKLAIVFELTNGTFKDFVLDIGGEAE